MSKQLNNIKFLILDVDGTMTDGGIYMLEDGSQFKKFNAKDGLGIKMAIKAGIDVGIISHSHSSEMVNTRANMLGLKHVYVGQDSKLMVLNRWLSELKINIQEIAFIGDDVNDKEIMGAVGFSACPADASLEIKQIADLTLTCNGGHGAVREFIDKYLLL